MSGFFILLRITLFHAACSQVGFYPNDRFDPGRGCRVIKVHCPKHGAVIGETNSRHAQIFGARDQLLDIAEAVEQRIFRMNMQVNKRHG